MPQHVLNVRGGQEFAAGLRGKSTLRPLPCGACATHIFVAHKGVAWGGLDLTTLYMRRAGLCANRARAGQRSGRRPPGHAWRTSQLATPQSERPRSQAPASRGADC